MQKMKFDQKLQGGHKQVLLYYVKGANVITYVKRNSAKASIVVPEIKNYGCLPKREMLDRRGF